MIRAALALLVIAIFAFLLGANGIAGVSLEISKVLLVVFLALAAIPFFISLSRRSERSALAVTTSSKSDQAEDVRSRAEDEGK